jgi:hypothetical protein
LVSTQARINTIAPSSKFDASVRQTLNGDHPQLTENIVRFEIDGEIPYPANSSNAYSGLALDEKIEREGGQTYITPMEKTNIRPNLWAAGNLTPQSVRAGQRKMRKSLIEFTV